MKWRCFKKCIIHTSSNLKNGSNPKLVECPPVLQGLMLKCIRINGTLSRNWRPEANCLIAFVTKESLLKRTLQRLSDKFLMLSTTFISVMSFTEVSHKAHVRSDNQLELTIKQISSQKTYCILPNRPIPNLYWLILASPKFSKGMKFSQLWPVRLAMQHQR